ncbi:MAG: hypothetical protein AAGD35_04560 [Actinomycetota bacterium]
MAPTSPSVVEMPVDPAAGTMPTYDLILRWLEPELAGLTDEQLDLDDRHPDREWMWWSIRRQVSHMAWDSLIFPNRRCAPLLWPDGAVPDPIEWGAHRMRPGTQWDRVLDEDRFWTVSELLAPLRVGIGWLHRVVTEQSIETLRATTTSVHGTSFWAYVITTLPRGASLVEDPPGHIHYDLEGSLWMVFYELLTHIRTIQRLKGHQGLATAVELPRVGYLRLPEYWGETDRNGPGMERLTTSSEATTTDG